MSFWWKLKHPGYRKDPSAEQQTEAQAVLHHLREAQHAAHNLYITWKLDEQLELLGKIQVELAKAHQLTAHIQGIAYSIEPYFVKNLEGVKYIQERYENDLQKIIRTVLIEFNKAQRQQRLERSAMESIEQPLQALVVWMDQLVGLDQQVLEHLRQGRHGVQIVQANNVAA